MELNILIKTLLTFSWLTILTKQGKPTSRTLRVKKKHPARSQGSHDLPLWSEKCRWTALPSGMGTCRLLGSPSLADQQGPPKMVVSCLRLQRGWDEGSSYPVLECCLWRGMTESLNKGGLCCRGSNMSCDEWLKKLEKLSQRRKDPGEKQQVVVMITVFSSKRWVLRRKRNWFLLCGLSWW